MMKNYDVQVHSIHSWDVRSQSKKTINYYLALMVEAMYLSDYSGKLDE
jgi:hypothetical protein